MDTKTLNEHLLGLRDDLIRKDPITGYRAHSHLFPKFMRRETTAAPGVRVLRAPIGGLDDVLTTDLTVRQLDGQTSTSP